jgi:hypothetical protein
MLAGAEDMAGCFDIVTVCSAMMMGEVQDDLRKPRAGYHHRMNTALYRYREAGPNIGHGRPAKLDAQYD